MKLKNDFVYFYPVKIEKDKVELKKIDEIEDLPTDYLNKAIIRFWDEERKMWIGEGFLFQNEFQDKIYISSFDEYYNLVLYNIDDFNDIINYHFHYTLKKIDKPLTEEMFQSILSNRYILSNYRVFIDEYELTENIPLEFREEEAIYLGEHIYRFNHLRTVEYDEFEVDGLTYILLIMKSVRENNSERVNIKYALICIDDFPMETNKQFYFFNIYQRSKELYSLFHDVSKENIIYKGNLFIRYLNSEEDAIKKINKIRNKFGNKKLPFLYHIE